MIEIVDKENEMMIKKVFTKKISEDIIKIVVKYQREQIPAPLKLVRQYGYNEKE